MAESKNPVIRLQRRLRRLYERRRKAARERREHYRRTGQPLKARRALRVIRRYADKGQVALRKIRAARKQDRRVGKVVVLRYANRPGASVTGLAMGFFQRVAEEADRTITINCGTNHSRYTTSGNISDHWSGNAGDFGISWNNGDVLMAAVLRTCGWSNDAAANAARRGGLYNVAWKGHRVQVIWKTRLGGNHYDHVHIGIR